MSVPHPDYYAALGVERAATSVEIRDAYRLLAKRYHPDRNRDSAEARLRTQELNAAYEVLRDPARRRAYDQELGETSRAAAPGRGVRIEHNITQEVRLRIEEFIRGTTIEVQVRDPANRDGSETYHLTIPAGTAPGARFRLARKAPMERGSVQIRLKVLPGYRFKARGSDLLCELRIDARRAIEGGSETMEKPTGGFLKIQIPAGAKRGEIVRLRGEGMPKPRGGRGDLLVRITYRPEVRITRNR
ncbi:MAG: DnaJ domain-containing protein [Verrucomicrobiota bacterium]|nr:DnaJ domain-containing protein [Verrucomicrobiota bacterium]